MDAGIFKDSRTNKFITCTDWDTYRRGSDKRI